MRIKLLALFFIVVYLSGCYPYYYDSFEAPQYTPPATRYIADYDISLIEVSRPAKASSRYGPQKIEKILENGINKYFFEDQMIKIIWFPSVTEFSFVINNKTDHSIRIIWDETAYSDESGLSRRLMHSGVKTVDRNNSQPPSVIIRKGSLADFIIPADNVYWREGFYGDYISTPGGWETKPLFPILKEGGTAESFQNSLKQYIDKTFQILLPLQIEDIINDYVFIFKINNAVVPDDTSGVAMAKGYWLIEFNDGTIKHISVQEKLAKGWDEIYREFGKSPSDLKHIKAGKLLISEE